MADLNHTASKRSAYYAAHRERRKAESKAYYEANKDRINSLAREKSKQKAITAYHGMIDRPGNGGVRAKDLTGMVFGRLAVTGFHRDSNGQLVWECLCECGTACNPLAGNLTSGKTQSCGCLNQEKRAERISHGCSKTKAYRSWSLMKSRCLNPNHEHWDCYGGRGITVCDRWINSFAAFYQDMGDRPTGKTLDRIDVNGNYGPNNCKWSTQQEQMANTRRSKARVGLADNT